MNFITPSKTHPQDNSSNTQDHEKQIATNYKMGQSLEDGKETPRISYEYVSTKDRRIGTSSLRRIKVNRGKIIDWFLQDELLDVLIGEHDYVNVKNIHIVGVVCIFMSSKYSNVQPLRLAEVISQICHNHFSKQQLISQQQKIFGLIFKNSYIQRHTVYHYLIEEFEHCDSHLLCEVLQWIVLVWTNIESALQELGVYTYRQLVRKVMYFVSRGLEFDCLRSILQQNERKWGTSACAWRKYSYKIHL